jgi:FkbM family methyltransferase
VRAIVKAFLRKFGIILMKQSSRVYLSENESYRIALEQCGEAAPVIIDGGAHVGETVDAFRSVVPHAKFHCFEPDTSLAAGLQAKFAGDCNVHVVAAALGAEPGMAVFNINASRPTSSLLPAAKGLQPELQGLCRTVKQVEVPLTSIDAYFANQRMERIDIVKLDLQGYDYHALIGASRVLQVVRVVMVEVLFIEIYQGCHLFPDILHLMGEHGFKLFTLSGIHYGAHDELLWADAIFVKESRQTYASAAAA